MNPTPRSATTIRIAASDRAVDREQSFHHLNYQPRGNYVGGSYAKYVSTLEFIE